MPDVSLEVYRSSLKQQDQTGRRVGLSRSGYRLSSLHPNIKIPGKEVQSKLPLQKVLAKFKQDLEMMEDIDDSLLALPKDSDDDDSDNGFQNVNIKPSTFERASEEPTKRPAASWSAPSRAAKRKTVNGKDPNAMAKSGSQRSSGTKTSPSSSIGSFKRKSQEDLSELGKDMLDVFGRANVKKFKKSNSQTTYSRSSQSMKLSSQPNKKKPPQCMSLAVFKFISLTDKVDAIVVDSDGNDSSIKFIKPYPIKGADDEDSPTVKTKIWTVHIDDSPQKSDGKEQKIFRNPSQIVGSPTVSPGSAKKKFIPIPKDFDSPVNIDDDDEMLPAFKQPLGDSLNDSSFSLSPVRTSRPNKLDLTEDTEPPATQYAPFRMPDLFGGPDVALIKTAGRYISKHLPSERPLATFGDDFPTNTQLGQCPMCNAQIDANELRASGNMNTRQQEKFCRTHQRKTAEQNWEINKYPEIEWENLDSRIAKHHSFIKELVDGKDCHYRELLDEKVKAGKDRNLLKMTSNLTPGYYGSRGLREISESIMKEFTPLLKKRGVTDRLMAARGVTGFVQSVLVPEVTLLLIMEDMGVEKEKARDILTDSVAIGELVHEEIKDVVPRQVEDSEDDDFDD